MATKIITIYLKDSNGAPFRCQHLSGVEYDLSYSADMVELSGCLSEDGNTLHTYYIPKANIQYIEVKRDLRAT